MSQIISLKTQDSVNAYTSRAWACWAVAACFYMYQFVLRVSPNVMMHDLMSTFAIDAATVGSVAAFYYYAYAGLQIPVGVLLDKFGPRRILLVATLLCALGGLIFTAAEGLAWLKLGRFLMGAGSAFAFAGTMKTATIWFRGDKMSIITGLTVTLGTSGGISAGYPLAFLIGLWGWRQALNAFVIAGFALALVLWLVVRDRAPYTQDEPTLTQGWSDVWQGFLDVVSKPALWALAVYGACMYVPLSAFADTWGASFLSKMLNIDMAQASGISSMIYIGMAVGGALSGAFTNYTGSHKITMLTAAIFTGALFSIVVFVPNLTIASVTTLLFLVGFFCSGHFMSFVSACTLTTKRTNATAVGFVNMVTMTSGVVFQPLIGHLLDSRWTGAMEGNMRLYSFADYQFAVAAIPLSLVLGLILALFLKKTGPRYGHAQ